MSKTKITNETFSIGFDGIAFDRHEIPAVAFAQSLLAQDALARRTAEAVYGEDVETEIRVKAGFKQGLFTLILMTAEAALNFLQPSKMMISSQKYAPAK